MVSQLLFGETYTILEEQTDWVHIVTSFDHYEAWLTRQHHTPIAADEYQLLQQTAPTYSLPDCSKLSNEIGDYSLRIVAGSTLPHFEQPYCRIAGKNYLYWGATCENGLHPKQRLIIKYAKRYLGTPYMWGGRSPLGIDCSGFSQMAYKMAGLALRRDAYQQAEQGHHIASLAEAQQGDLAFFNSEKEQTRITHVGILLNTHQIIHAHTTVRIDKIDRIGIIHPDNGKYSHYLLAIKRHDNAIDLSYAETFAGQE